MVDRKYTVILVSHVWFLIVSNLHRKHLLLYLLIFPDVMFILGRGVISINKGIRNRRLSLSPSLIINTSSLAGTEPCQFSEILYTNPLSYLPSPRHVAHPLKCEPKYSLDCGAGSRPGSWHVTPQPPPRWETKRWAFVFRSQFVVAWRGSGGRKNALAADCKESGWKGVWGICLAVTRWLAVSEIAAVGPNYQTVTAKRARNFGELERGFSCVSVWGIRLSI